MNFPRRVCATPLSLISIVALVAIGNSANALAVTTPSRDKTALPYQATLVRQDSPSSITGFELNPGPYPLEEKLINGARKVTATLEARQIKPDHSLLLGTKFISQKDSSQQAIKVALILEGEESPFDLIEIDPMGNSKTEKIILRFPEWEEWMNANSVTPGSPSQPKNRFFIGLSPTFISYQETGVESYSETALTLKASYTQKLSSKWDGSLSGFGTLLPITKSDSATTAKFYGINLRAGYAPNFFRRSKWKLTLFGGVYYTTMLVTENRFGFKNMAGPQLYPALVRTLRNGNVVSGYVKYSPVSNTFEGFSISNRELAFGLAHHWSRPKNRSILGTFDVSNLRLLFPSGIVVNTTTFSLGAGYSF